MAGVLLLVAGGPRRIVEVAVAVALVADLVISYIEDPSPFIGPFDCLACAGATQTELLPLWESRGAEL